MLKQKNNNSSAYGTFTAKKRFDLHSRTARISGAVFIILFLTLGSGLFLMKKDNAKNIVSVPEAYASDSLPGWWYDEYFHQSTCDSEWCKATSDPDSDKLTNAQEFYYNTDPLKEDTNGNSLDDGKDVAMGYDPSKPGKITFEKASSSDSIFEESVLYEDDIKKEFAKSIDPNGVVLPLPLDQELVIIENVSSDTFGNYTKQLNDAAERYFPKKKMEELVVSIQSGDEYQLNTLKSNSAEMVVELKKLPVPAQLKNFHKYSIAFYELLPKVLEQPSQAVQEDIYSIEGNLWFDNARAFMIIMQKMDLEMKMNFGSK